LLFYKRHTGRACISYDAAVEEALCFGWIDGKLRRIDDDKHVIRFSPRRPRSVWSESNKRRVREMIEQDRMTEAGLALVRAAKESGAWDRASQPVPDAPPGDLASALSRNKRAQKRFEAMAPSHRRNYIAWVLDAKRAETRARRIRQVVRRAAKNKRPGQ
jgi:uncharacterized protein YdeI (YjbR/CyaY-like superfamily)